MDFPPHIRCCLWRRYLYSRQSPRIQQMVWGDPTQSPLFNIEMDLRVVYYCILGQSGL